MKKMTILLIVFMVTIGIYAKSYIIDEHEEINLKGVDKIIFSLISQSSGIGFSFITGNENYLFTGAERSELSLSLEGELKSNNKNAIPSLIVGKHGRTVTVLLYEKEKNFYFGLIKNGSVNFYAEIPDYFNGDIEIRTSSGDTTIDGLTLNSLVLDSSSGNNDIENIGAENIEIKASSGDLSVSHLKATKLFQLKSSSGDLKIDNILAQESDIRASSGRINIGKLKSTEELLIDSSSGRITAELLESRTINIEASSGEITVDKTVSEHFQAKSSSGDLLFHEIAAYSTDLHASSGKITMGVETLKGDINLKSNSGDIRLTLPEGTAFLAEFRSSGRIRSDFKLLGDVSERDDKKLTGEVNGGGFLIKAKASSGNITIIEE